MVGRLDQLRAQLSNAMIRQEKPARPRRLFFIALVCGLLAFACDGSKDRPPVLSARSETAGAVDSILPMDEAIRRFRAGLPVVRELAGGAASRGELVAAFVHAIERNDTAAVRRMLVSRAEYAYLYFPSSAYMSEPYRQAPAVAWFLNAENSDKGISRVLRRLGGHDLEWRGYGCAGGAREGENLFSRLCTLDYLDPQEKKWVTRRLFGSIIERGGRYKFLSYANDF